VSRDNEDGDTHLGQYTLAYSQMIVTCSADIYTFPGQIRSIRMSHVGLGDEVGEFRCRIEIPVGTFMMICEKWLDMMFVMVYTCTNIAWVSLAGVDGTRYRYRDSIVLPERDSNHHIAIPDRLI
jgi:hypothetical protein